MELGGDAVVKWNDGHGQTLVHGACGRDPSLASTRRLLELDADPNSGADVVTVVGTTVVGTTDNWTPLSYCAEHGTAKHLEIARCLIDHGANRLLKTKTGKTPLDRARQNGHTGMARLLEEYVAPPPPPVAVQASGQVRSSTQATCRCPANPLHSAQLLRHTPSSARAAGVVVAQIDGNCRWSPAALCPLRKLPQRIPCDAKTKRSAASGLCLKKLSTIDSKYNCDKHDPAGREKITKGTTMYGCRTCNYDVCIECWKKFGPMRPGASHVPGQAIPGGYRVGDEVFSRISHADKHGSFTSGTKGRVTGAADENRDTKLEVQFQGYGSKMDVWLTSISRDPDSNKVK